MLQPRELPKRAYGSLHPLAGILCASLYLNIKTGRLDEFMSIEDLTTEARYLSDLLKIEFVFPLAGIEENVRNTLDTLVREQVLVVENDSHPARVRLSEKERSTGREQVTFDTVAC